MEKIYVKNEHLFKNKFQMIIYLIIFGILIYLFIYLGTKDYNLEIPDNERFASEFSLVSEDNVFKYVNVNEVRNVIAESNGIILFGTKNEWVNYYASILNTAAQEMGISEIYYYEFLKNRQDNNGSYEDIVNTLEEYVTYNDRGIGEIYAPTLLIIHNNQIILFDSETAFINGKIDPSEYWTSFNEQQKVNEFKAAFQKYLES